MGCRWPLMVNRMDAESERQAMLFVSCCVSNVGSELGTFINAWWLWDSLFLLRPQGQVLKCERQFRLLVWSAPETSHSLGTLCLQPPTLASVGLGHHCGKLCHSLHSLLSMIKR